MNKNFFFTAAAFATVFSASAAETKKAATPAAVPAPAAKAPEAAPMDMATALKVFSYSQGLMMGQNLSQANAEGQVNSDEFLNGLKLGLSGAKNTLYTDAQTQQAVGVLQAAFAKKASAEQGKLAVTAKKDAFKDMEVKTTASGLEYVVVTAGTGAKPAVTDTVKVHYTGKLLNGTVFDSSVQRGTPAEFGLSQVIPGWTEGLQLMAKGAKYTFYIPSALAYGERGAGQSIPPNSDLTFEVELLDIVAK